VAFQTIGNGKRKMCKPTGMRASELRAKAEIPCQWRFSSAFSAPLLPFSLFSVAYRSLLLRDLRPDSSDSIGLTAVGRRRVGNTRCGESSTWHPGRILAFSPTFVFSSSSSTPFRLHSPGSPESHANLGAARLCAIGRGRRKSCGGPQAGFELVGGSLA